MFELGSCDAFGSVFFKFAEGELNRSQRTQWTTMDTKKGIGKLLPFMEQHLIWENKENEGLFPTFQ